MCFSAEASAGVAAAVLPVGGYCLAAAWRKDRAYLPLAAAPLLFGLQQSCEARVWDALGGTPGLARRPSLAFLFFALAVWPVLIPAAAAAIEPPGRKRQAFAALAGVGVLFALAYYLPLATGERGPSPSVVGHSIRYDFAEVPTARSAWWWTGPALYLVATCVPLLASGDRRLRPLGVALAASAGLTYALFESAFASAWCFFAAALSLYLAYALHCLPDRRRPAVQEGVPATQWP
jgi:hypothetical protein